MRTLLPLLLLWVAPSARASCSVGPGALGVAKCADGRDVHQACLDALRSHVRNEFEASLQYLLMGAYFGQDDVSLAGLSAFFFSHADEERGHGIKFIEYLRMRGDADADFLGRNPIVPTLGKTSWSDATSALSDALQMEKSVTTSLKSLVEVCDVDGDVHAADWISGEEWIGEQLEGQRKLAGMINSLRTFRRGHEELADWMFDRQLQEGEDE